MKYLTNVLFNGEIVLEEETYLGSNPEEAVKLWGSDSVNVGMEINIAEESVVFFAEITSEPPAKYSESFYFDELDALSELENLTEEELEKLLEEELDAWTSDNVEITYTNY